MILMLLNDFLSRCSNVKQVSNNQYACDCPCCNDTKRHLYVSCSDTHILLDCKKGCNWLDVLRAFNLHKKDLYFNFNNNNRWEFLRSHEYCDVTGKKLAVKEIYKKPDGSKTAFWKHYNSTGFLEKGLNGLKLPLYRANVIAHMYNDDVLFIVEGEKDVDTLTRLCFYATTSPNGAGSRWSSKRFNQYLKDKDIIILSDNDDVGIKYATEVAECVSDVAKSVKLVNASVLYPDLQNKGDISDVVEILGDNKTIELLNGIISSDYYIYIKNKYKEDNEDNSELPEWMQDLRYDYRGNLFRTVRNAYIIIKNDENYKDKINFNDFTSQIELNHTKWTDYDDFKLKMYIDDYYGCEFSSETLNQAYIIIAKENIYHPIKKYLDGCKWDGIDRLHTVFHDFLGCEDNVYTRKVAEITFLGAVARVLNPGCQYDTCTTFVGKQGIGKSKFIRKIAYNVSDWYTDSVSSFDGKDFFEQSTGKWIIELGEGTVFQKSTKEKVKQVITSRFDTYRRPYGRHSETIPRQCIFLATTNNYDFLKDETGDRRFYPIDCDISKSSKSIDNDLDDYYICQLWGQAKFLFLSGCDIYIKDKNVLEIAEYQQSLHYDESPLQSDIYNFLNILIPDLDEWYQMSLEQRRRYIKSFQNGEDTSKSLGLVGRYKRDRVSVKEIMCEFYGYEINQPIERKMSLDVSRCLKSLGLSKSNKTEWVKPYGAVKVFIYS